MTLPGREDPAERALLEAVAFPGGEPSLLEALVGDTPVPHLDGEPLGALPSAVLLRGPHALHSPKSIGEIGAPEVDADLTRAAALLSELWPASMTEVRLLVRFIAASRTPPRHLSSGSSASHPYVIGLAYPAEASALVLADTLVHEASHVKLRLYGARRLLVVGDDPPRWHHPWRPEARPLQAVLVAAHAFAAVFHLHALARSRGLTEDSYPRQLREEVARALASLDRAPGLSNEGRLICAVLGAAHRRSCELLG